MLKRTLIVAEEIKVGLMLHNILLRFPYYMSTSRMVIKIILERTFFRQCTMFAETRDFLGFREFKKSNKTEMAA